MNRSRQWVIGAVSSLLAVWIALMVNYLAFRHYTRWDWTESQLFTLSSQTKKVVRGLTSPLDIYLFLSEGEGNYADVRELLSRYRAENPKLRVRTIDPDRKPTEYQVLAERFGLGAIAVDPAAGAEGGVASDVAAVVAQAKNTWKITRDDLLSPDFGSLEESGGRQVNVKTERAFTGAIVQVTQGRATRLCVTQDHGEWRISGPGERTLGPVVDELQRNNIELEPVAVGKLGKSCDAAFVIGPQRAFTAKQASLLKSYVRGGGNLLLALDPVLEREEIQPTGLEAMLAEFGVMVDQAVVLELDPERLLSPSPLEAFLAVDFQPHKTTEALIARGGGAVFHLARSVRAASTGPAKPLIRPSQQAYGETRLGELSADSDLRAGDQDIKAPELAVVAEGLASSAAKTDTSNARGSADSEAGRLVVMGDSDWMRGAFVEQPQFANIDVVSALSGWLTQRDALISIAPRKSDAQSLVMSDADLGGLLFRVVVLLPLAVLLLGFSTWWSRRS